MGFEPRVMESRVRCPRYQLSNQISKSHSQLDLEFLRQERLVDRNVLVSLELKESGYNMLSKDFKDFI